MSNLCQNNFKWVNTEVEFKWDPELQRYVEVYSDGYCYDGEWATADQPVTGPPPPPGVTPQPGGGGTSDPPTFSFRQPHAYDINDGIYGLGITDADGNPFEKIPAVLNYEEHHHGAAGLVCKCTEQNGTECTIDYTKCVLWTVYPYIWNNNHQYYPYAGTNFSSTWNYNTTQYTNICNAAMELGAPADSEWDGTPCLDLNQSTCIPYSIYNSWMGDISTWEGTTQFANIYGGMWDNTNNRDNCNDAIMNNYGSGYYNMVWKSFGGTTNNTNPQESYNSWNDVIESSEPIYIAGQGPRVVSFSDNQSSPGWVAKYNSDNEVGDVFPDDVQSSGTQCADIGLGEGTTLNSGDCPPLGEYLSEYEQFMKIYDTSDNTLSTGPLYPCFVFESYFSGNLPTPSEFLNATGGRLYFENQSGMSLSDVQNYGYGQYCHQDQNFDNDYNSPNGAWPFLQLGNWEHNINFHGNGDPGWIMCCTEGHQKILGDTITFTMMGTDYQNDNIQYWFDDNGNSDFQAISDFVPSGTEFTHDFIYNTAGIKNPTIKILDENNNWSAEHTIELNIQSGPAPPNEAPTITPQWPSMARNIPVGETTFPGDINIIWTVDDVDGDDLSTTFYLCDDSQCSSSSSLGTEDETYPYSNVSYSITGGTLEAGTYYYGAQVIDSDGSATLSPMSVVTLTVHQLENEVPNVNFVINSESGLTVTLKVNGSSDNDGTIETVTIDWGDGESTTREFSGGMTLNHTYPSEGEKTIQVFVTDNFDGNSSTQTLTTNFLTNKKPVLDWSHTILDDNLTDSSPTPNAPVSFSVQDDGSHDPDGDINEISIQILDSSNSILHERKFDDDSTPTLDEFINDSTDFTINTYGRHKLKYIAKDNIGDKTEEIVEFYVSGPTIINIITGPSDDDNDGYVEIPVNSSPGTSTLTISDNGTGDQYNDITTNSWFLFYCGIDNYNCDDLEAANIIWSSNMGDGEFNFNIGDCIKLGSENGGIIDEDPFFDVDVVCNEGEVHLRCNYCFSDAGFYQLMKTTEDASGQTANSSVLIAVSPPGEPIFITGCTDTEAINYNATISDDSNTCIYSTNTSNWISSLSGYEPFDLIFNIDDISFDVNWPYDASNIYVIVDYGDGNIVQEGYFSNLSTVYNESPFGHTYDLAINLTNQTYNGTIYFLESKVNVDNNIPNFDYSSHPPITLNTGAGDTDYFIYHEQSFTVEVLDSIWGCTTQGATNYMDTANTQCTDSTGNLLEVQEGCSYCEFDGVIRINEFFHPACMDIGYNSYPLSINEGDKAKQWIELYNDSDHAISLEGWRLVTSIGTVPAANITYEAIFDETDIIQGKGYLVIPAESYSGSVEEFMALTTRIPDEFLLQTGQCESADGANNCNMILFTDLNVPVDVIGYQIATQDFVQMCFDETSFQRTFEYDGSGDNILKENWKLSYVYLGTKGTSNSTNQAPIITWDTDINNNVSDYIILADAVDENADFICDEIDGVICYDNNVFISNNLSIPFKVNITDNDLGTGGILQSYNLKLLYNDLVMCSDGKLYDYFYDCFLDCGDICSPSSEGNSVIWKPIPTSMTPGNYWEGSDPVFFIKDNNIGPNNTVITSNSSDYSVTLNEYSIDDYTNINLEFGIDYGVYYGPGTIAESAYIPAEIYGNYKIVIEVFDSEGGVSELSGPIFNFVSSPPQIEMEADLTGQIQYSSITIGTTTNGITDIFDDIAAIEWKQIDCDYHFLGSIECPYVTECNTDGGICSDGYYTFTGQYNPTSATAAEYTSRLTFTAPASLPGDNVNLNFSLSATDTANKTAVATTKVTLDPYGVVPTITYYNVPDSIYINNSFDFIVNIGDADSYNDYVAGNNKIEWKDENGILNEIDINYDFNNGALLLANSNNSSTGPYYGDLYLTNIVFLPESTEVQLQLSYEQLYDFQTGDITSDGIPQPFYIKTTDNMNNEVIGEDNVIIYNKSPEIPDFIMIDSEAYSLTMAGNLSLSALPDLTGFQIPANDPVCPGDTYNCEFYYLLYRVDDDQTLNQFGGQIPDDGDIGNNFLRFQDGTEICCGNTYEFDIEVTPFILGTPPEAVTRTLKVTHLGSAAAVQPFVNSGNENSYGLIKLEPQSISSELTNPWDQNNTQTLSTFELVIRDRHYPNASSEATQDITIQLTDDSDLYTCNDPNASNYSGLGFYNGNCIYEGCSEPYAVNYFCTIYDCSAYDNILPPSDVWTSLDICEHQPSDLNITDSSSSPLDSITLEYNTSTSGLDYFITIQDDNVDSAEDIGDGYTITLGGDGLNCGVVTLDPFGYGFDYDSSNNVIVVYLTIEHDPTLPNCTEETEDSFWVEFNDPSELTGPINNESQPFVVNYEIQYGCTDGSADNYNNSNVLDDGSCEFSVLGCTHPLASNVCDDITVIWDGSITDAVYTVTGCNVDDGSCIYPSCLDAYAMNYARHPNGQNWLDYGIEIGDLTSVDVCVYDGCNDSTAHNYQDESNPWYYYMGDYIERLNTYPADFGTCTCDGTGTVVSEDCFHGGTGALVTSGFQATCSEPTPAILPSICRPIEEGDSNAPDNFWPDQNASCNYFGDYTYGACNSVNYLEYDDNVNNFSGQEYCYWWGNLWKTLKFGGQISEWSEVKALCDDSDMCKWEGPTNGNGNCVRKNPSILGEGNWEFWLDDSNLWEVGQMGETSFCQQYYNEAIATYWKPDGYDNIVNPDGLPFCPSICTEIPQSGNNVSDCTCEEGQWLNHLGNELDWSVSYNPVSEGLYPELFEYYPVGEGNPWDSDYSSYQCIFYGCASQYNIEGDTNQNYNPTNVNCGPAEAYSVDSCCVSTDNLLLIEPIASFGISNNIYSFRPYNEQGINNLWLGALSQPASVSNNFTKYTLYIDECLNENCEETNPIACYAGPGFDQSGTPLTGYGWITYSYTGITQFRTHEFIESDCIGDCNRFKITMQSFDDYGANVIDNNTCSTISGNNASYDYMPDNCCEFTIETTTPSTPMIQQVEYLELDVIKLKPSIQYFGDNENPYLPYQGIYLNNFINLSDVEKNEKSFIDVVDEDKRPKLGVFNYSGGLDQHKAIVSDNNLGVSGSIGHIDTSLDHYRLITHNHNTDFPQAGATRVTTPWGSKAAVMYMKNIDQWNDGPICNDAVYCGNVYNQIIEPNWKFGIEKWKNTPFIDYKIRFKIKVEENTAGNSTDWGEEPDYYEPLNEIVDNLSVSVYSYYCSSGAYTGNVYYTFRDPMRGICSDDESPCEGDSDCNSGSSCVNDVNHSLEGCSTEDGSTWDTCICGDGGDKGYYSSTNTIYSSDLKNTRWPGWFQAEGIVKITNLGLTESEQNNIVQQIFTINDGGVITYNTKRALYIADVEILPMFNVDADIRTPQSIENSKGGLFYYWDKSLNPEEYKDSSGPTGVQFYFYPRYYYENMFVLKDYIENEYNQDYFYVSDIDWGDGQKEYPNEPVKIGFNTFLNHAYETSGIYTITGKMLFINNFASSAQRFEAVINISEKYNDFDYTYFGSDGFTYIPYKKTTPIIGGFSKESAYSKGIKRQIGFQYEEDTKPRYDLNFNQYTDKLQTEKTIADIEGLYGNTISAFTGSYSDDSVSPSHPSGSAYGSTHSGEQKDVIYESEYLFEELGDSIGYTDIGQIRYFKRPMQMWEMLGFEDNVAGNPSELRHWKNIIPEDYDIFTDFENYYYPVLPKINQYGLFDETMGLQFDTEGIVKIPFGSERNWNQDDMESSITNESYQDDSLLIDMGMSYIEENILNDNSLNGVVGVVTNDYRVSFEPFTNRPIKEQAKQTIEISDDRKPY